MIYPLCEIGKIHELHTYEHTERINTYLELLSKSERKVAEVILLSPQTAIHSTIAILARTAEVIKLTVNRFCRYLESKGYPDFKLHLA